MSKHGDIVYETEKYTVNVFLAYRDIDDPSGEMIVDQFGGPPYPKQIPDPDRCQEYNFRIPYNDRFTADSGYIVTNKDTGVFEFLTTSLPDAIYEAERMTDALLLSSWKWFAVRRAALAEGRIEDENAAMLKMMEESTSRTKKVSAKDLS